MQATELRDHVQRLFYYDRWANGQVFDILMKMDDVPQTDIDRMGHVAAALALWNARLTGKANPDIDMLHPGWSLAEGKARGRQWKNVVLVLEKLKVPPSRIEHLVQQDNPSLVAKLVEELMAKQ